MFYCVFSILDFSPLFIYMFSFYIYFILFISSFIVYFTCQIKMFFLIYMDVKGSVGPPPAGGERDR